MKRIMVTGGRDFDDYNLVYQTIQEISRRNYGDIVVIHGGARGADTLAEQAAHAMGLHTAKVVALWDAHGKGAGPLRNTTMLAGLKPDLVVAFPGGRGTADAVRKAVRYGVPVQEIANQTAG